MDESPAVTPDRRNIAILCPAIFFVHAYRDILRHLPEAEIIPDFTAGPPGTSFPEAAKDEFRLFLKESGLPWRDIETADKSPNEFFSKYGTVVAPFYGGWVAHPALKLQRKVRVFYGAAKDLWGFALWNAHFDLICTPGPYFTDTLNGLYGQHGVRTVSTGEPKLDALATLTKDAARASLEIVSEKPVVVVASTWGKLSALEKIAGHLIALSSRYFVIVKAHHMSAMYEPAALHAFVGTGVRVLEQRTPIASAIASADVVISDGSGAIFDALRADKPLIVLDTIGSPDEDFFLETAFYGMQDGKFSGVPTYASSTEQKIKEPHNLIAPVVEVNASFTAKVLQDALEDALAQPMRFAPARARLLASHFTPIDGSAGERVAVEIRTMARTDAPRGVHSASLLPALVRDFHRRAKSEEASLHTAVLDKNAEDAKKMRSFKRLPYAERLRAVIHEFFN